MHHHDKRYNELAEKWLNGSITDIEKKEFTQWYDEDPEAALNIPREHAGSEEELRLRIYNAITKQKNARVIIFRKSLVFKIAAACVIVMVCCGLLYYGAQQKKEIYTTPETAVEKSKTSISPGGNKAVLVLANGSELILNTAVNGTIAKDGNVLVTKLADGQLAYSSVKGRPAAVSYNTLSVPRGGQYAIVLPDATKVWLNSASSLRFPTAFVGRERTVELEGEAYFEASKNPHQPFIVRVNNIEVKVLGTHFNIMAYDDEEIIKTTLVEGAIRIHKNNSAALLKPGEQAQVGQSNQITIKKGADVEEAIAWKNGFFNFNGARIETILRQVARWYDVQIIYEGKITDHFTGSISKHAGIEKLFQMLELTGAVHFIIRGSRVIVRS
jgi:ferric-dicitrate binding protein FerR (iron transport regulator)